MIDEGIVVGVGFVRESETPTLYKGEVIESSDGIVVVAFTRPIREQSRMIGASAAIHCRYNGSFQKVNAMVQALLQTMPVPIFRFLVEGGAEFETAENRQAARFIAVSADLHAELGSEKNCPIADVSANGLSVVACAERKIGEVVRVTVIDGPEKHTGTVDIRSAHVREDNAFRYGLQATANANALCRGLSKISMSIQRAQLRRMRCRVQ